MPIINSAALIVPITGGDPPFLASTNDHNWLAQKPSLADALE
jgi:hypothetical protein